MHHIRSTLPDIKARISSQLQKYNAELISLGGAMGNQNSQSVVLNVITEFIVGYMIPGHPLAMMMFKSKSGANCAAFCLADYL